MRFRWTIDHLLRVIDACNVNLEFFLEGEISARIGQSIRALYDACGSEISSMASLYDGVAGVRFELYG